jgi:hypothetical protein
MHLDILQAIQRNEQEEHRDYSDICFITFPFAVPLVLYLLKLPCRVRHDEHDADMPRHHHKPELPGERKHQADG